MKWKPHPTGRLKPCNTQACDVVDHYRHVHLVSINVSQKTHSSTRSWFTAIVYSRRYAGLPASYGRNLTSSVVRCEGCGLWLCVGQKWERPVYLFSCLTSGWPSSVMHALDTYHGFHSISHHHHVLCLMHMHLISDAMYQEGSMPLMKNRHLIARCI